MLYNDKLRVHGVCVSVCVCVCVCVHVKSCLTVKLVLKSSFTLSPRSNRAHHC